MACENSLCAFAVVCEISSCAFAAGTKKTMTRAAEVSFDSILLLKVELSFASKILILSWIQSPISGDLELK